MAKRFGTLHLQDERRALGRRVKQRNTEPRLGSPVLSVDSAGNKHAIPDWSEVPQGDETSTLIAALEPASSNRWTQIAD